MRQSPGAGGSCLLGGRGKNEELRPGIINGGEAEAESSKESWAKTCL